MPPSAPQSQCYTAVYIDDCGVHCVEYIVIKETVIVITCGVYCPIRVELAIFNRNTSIIYIVRVIR